nr:hypothetical protein [Methyloceanibacter marginalis]
MLGVPHDVGREQRQRDSHGDDDAAALEGLARLAGHRGVAGDADQRVNHCLFGEKADADRRAEQNGEAHALPFHQHDPEKEHDGP